MWRTMTRMWLICSLPLILTNAAFMKLHRVFVVSYATGWLIKLVIVAVATGGSCTNLRLCGTEVAGQRKECRTAVIPGSDAVSLVASQITSDAIAPCWKRCTRRSSTIHRFDA